MGSWKNSIGGILRSGVILGYSGGRGVSEGERKNGIFRGRMEFGELRVIGIKRREFKKVDMVSLLDVVNW